MQDKAAILIKQAVLLADKISNPILSPYHLTPSQFKIIKYILMFPPNAVRQTDIEEHFELKNPTVTGILQNLEKNGWIKRVQNPEDARSKVISATEKTLSLQQELKELGDCIEHSLTAKLSDQERQELIRILKKILSD